MIHNLSPLTGKSNSQSNLTSLTTKSLVIIEPYRESARTGSWTSSLKFLLAALQQRFEVSPRMTMGRLSGHYARFG
jgi:hypothetical protein